jgi:hypothetical protein
MTIAADTSSYGIGAVLTQKQGDNTWRPVTYISRAMTDTEKRYAQGISKCQPRAKQSVWWPGIAAQIRQAVDRCEICQKRRAQYREPLILTSVPERP